MRFIAKISSFMLDAAVTLVGMAFVGAGAIMFGNDIKVAKGEKKHGDQASED